MPEEESSVNSINGADHLNQNEVEESSDDIKALIAKLLVVFERLKQLTKDYLWLLLLVFICGIGITVYKVLNKDITYQSSVMFILKDEMDNSSQASAIDPLSAYLLSRQTVQGISVDMLKDISFSQKVLTNTMFNKCIIRGKSDYLINHILVIYYGKGNSYFRDFRGLNALNRNQYRVFNNVCNLVKASSSIIQGKSGSFFLNVEMSNEELAKVTTELLYQNVSNFYIDKTTEKAQLNYIFLKNRLDSIRNLLYSSEYQVANFEDRARNLLLQTARVPQQRQIRNMTFYSSLYGDLISSFEKAKITLNNITPVFQILSRPYYPLDVNSKPTSIIVLVGGFVTGLVMLILLGVLYVKRFIWPEYKPLFQKRTQPLDET